MNIDPDTLSIAELVPHRGAMCLLERVVDVAAESIRCTAGSHRLADNPLRFDGCLPVVAAIEYAAQAMAAHALLVASSGDAAPAPRTGYLVGVRDFAPKVERLDQLPAPLIVDAQRIATGPGGLIYQFTVSAGALEVASGRAAVALGAGGGRDH